MSRRNPLLSALAALVLISPVGAQDRAPEPPSLTQGLDLYGRQCSHCHGADGGAEGLVPSLLQPRPRAFGDGVFKVVSTTRSMPHDDDILQVVRDGMPGSAMPAFGHLSQGELRDVVAAVRHLMLEGRIAAEGEVDRATALERALERIDPGARLELSRESPRTPASMLRGQEIYTTICAHCHDDDGCGVLRTDFVDDRGLPTSARDFTHGVFKGGSTSEDLARRIRLGMPGTPMPAFDLSDGDLWSVVHYVQTLVEPGVQEHLRQRRKLITARRVDDRLDAHAHGADWDRAPEVFVPLMPLQWRRDHTEGVSVRALHDGRHLALRLDWPDGARDDGTEGLALDDGIAVQLSTLRDPPFFGMGESSAPVAILEWRAAWQQALPNAWASRPVLAPDLPGPGGDGPRRADGSSPVVQGLGGGIEWPVRGVSGSGPGMIHGAPALDADVRGRGLRNDGGWSVVLYRQLESPDEGLSLGPGDLVSTALAVWDGGAGDVGPRKSITIWHQLLLEP
jgi:mono/diheme cytochrome c family protein